MTLNSFHDTSLRNLENEETTGFLMYFRKYRKRSVPKNELRIFLTNIHASTMTEHAFYWSTCTDSFNALKICKVSMFSDLS